MSTDRTAEIERDPKWSRRRLDGETNTQSFASRSANSADEVLGEVGLILVVVLGLVLAINMVLVGLHIG